MLYFHSVLRVHTRLHLKYKATDYNVLYCRGTISYDFIYIYVHNIRIYTHIHARFRVRELVVRVVFRFRKTL